MTKSDVPDPAVYAKWAKLAMRSEDRSDGNGNTERATAKSAAAKIVADNPWIPAYHKRVVGAGAGSASSASSSAPASSARDIIASVLQAAMQRAATEAPRMAEAILSTAAQRATQAAQDTIMGKSSKSASVPPSRATTAELLSSVDLAGVTLSDESDDAASDVIAVALTVPADIAEALLARVEQSEGSKRLVQSLGELVIAALRETYEDGEAGEWPFGDGGEEEDEED